MARCTNSYVDFGQSNGRNNDAPFVVSPREFLLRGEDDDAQICASSNFASKLPNKSVNLPPLKSLKRGETGNSNLNQVNNDFP
jgi:hypothetical protein